MTDKKDLALREFSSKTMLENIEHLRTMIQRIRQKEGGLGSPEDEMSLHRAIQDLDLLVDIVDGVKTAFFRLQAEYDTLAESATAYKTQQEGKVQVLNRMIEERNARIKELEASSDDE